MRIPLGKAVLVPLLLLPAKGAMAGEEKEDLYQKGEAAYLQGDLNGGLGFFRAAPARNEVRAHYRVGLILEAQGRDREALAHYGKFIQLGLPGPDRADAQRRAHRFRRALESRAPQTQDLLTRGRTILSQGQVSEARDHLLQAGPSNPDAHYFLGEAYLELGMYEEAQASFDRAKTLYR